MAAPTPTSSAQIIATVCHSGGAAGITSCGSLVPGTKAADSVWSVMVVRSSKLWALFGVI
jgi:hypothetical protein